MSLKGNHGATLRVVFFVQVKFTSKHKQIDWEQLAGLDGLEVHFHGLASRILH